VINGVDAVGSFFASLPGKIWAGIQSLATGLRDFFVNTWNSAKTAVAEGVVAVVDFFRNLPGRAITAIGNLISNIRDFFNRTWNSAVQATAEGAVNLINWVKGIPGKILGALGDLGGVLFRAGKAIIQGLIDGIKAAAGALGGVVKDILGKVRSLLPFSPAKEGPFSGRGWTLYSGMSIVQALADGIKLKTGAAVGEAARMAAAVSDAMNITTPGVGAPIIPSVPDFTQKAAVAGQAQADATNRLAGVMAGQGDLGAALADALTGVQVVVSAQETASAVNRVNKSNSRR
jgi:phage-related protein